MGAMVAFTPFLEPMDLQTVWWWLLLPLALLVSVGWKAVRVGHFRSFWRPVLIMTVQIVVAMAGLAVATALVVEFLVPLLPGS